jgi:hypothetical protein
MCESWAAEQLEQVVGEGPMPLVDLCHSLPLQVMIYLNFIRPVSLTTTELRESTARQSSVS